MKRDIKSRKPNPEKRRLIENKNTNKWSLWGPYLSERQWGTVREDYSANGDVWNYMTHEMARSKAFRWGEDGIGGICDDKQQLCFSFAFWNGKDKIIKERLFGLTGKEGNHGEDVKECYYYLDNIPTHAYMKMLYKYPQNEFPYEKLLEENKKRSRNETEYELIDTGIFDSDDYFDIFIEYAKAGFNDILIKITVYNRSSGDALLNIIPQLWFRNTWAWGYDNYKPKINSGKNKSLLIEHNKLGNYHFYYQNEPGLLFCDNETNVAKLYNTDAAGYFKDGINEFLTNKNDEAINPDKTGTKAGLHYNLMVSSKENIILKFRLTGRKNLKPFSDFDNNFEKRKNEADTFFNEIANEKIEPDTKNIQRQALSGLLWNKQFYYYDVRHWLKGDKAQPPPPAERLFGRNSDWQHLNNKDIILMSDNWEYPWFAFWDMSFHCVALASIDSEFAKSQLKLLTREWYMHPSGQFPAYEWNFSDVNPPVHAWAAYKVFLIDKKNKNGKGDLSFLESVFHKLLLNFTWWVNRKDTASRNIFQGGFLGLDNIGVFNRSSELPTGGYLEQADATSWMAMYSLNLMMIALELSKTNKVYEDTATKFLEHFLYIANAMTNIGNKDIDLWDNEDEFFYDILNTPGGNHIKIKVRSIIGLIPLFAVEVIDPDIVKTCSEFAKRMDWFLNYRPDLASLVSRWHVEGHGESRLFSLLRGHRMKRLLKRMLDETEFLSDYGIRALSKYHKEHPYVFNTNGNTFAVNYEPGESQSGIFGGNSNWRGPIWFPINYLIIESLNKFYKYYGDDFKVECSTNSGRYLTLKEIAVEISIRLSKIFLKNNSGLRPVFGNCTKFQNDPNFKDYILFFEHFNGDTGRGLGASHQTGWTALISLILNEIE